MTPEAQRIAIAEAVGFKRIGMIEGSPNLMGDLPPCRGWIEIPDYLNDLNAMHSVEETLSEKQEVFYLIRLAEVMKENHTIGWKLERTYHATAAQRADAFLRTIGKYT